MEEQDSNHLLLPLSPRSLLSSPYAEMTGLAETGAVSAIAPLPGSVKRKASGAGLTERPYRPVKRRASKACHCCRARKVRCNVVEHGAPCTNCRLDEVDCVVTESKRRRKVFSKPAPDLAGMAKQAPANVLDGVASVVVASPSSRAPAASATEDHVSHTLYRAHACVAVKNGTTASPALTPSPDTFSGRCDSAQRSESVSRSASGLGVASRIALPDYIKPLCSVLSADDLAYLEHKGAHSIPERALRDELLRCWAEYVHPFLPILDLHTVTDAITAGNGNRGQISLLVFQSIMFAGSASVSLDSLRRAGYGNRKQARQYLLKKTRLLYDLDCEKDEVAQIQALLLLTVSHQAFEVGKNAQHWLSIAISSAMAAGYNRREIVAQLPSEQGRSVRRLWSACLVLDNLFALATSSSTRIKGDDYDAHLPKLDSSSFVNLSGSSSLSLSSGLLNDIGSGDRLAVLFNHRIDLIMARLNSAIPSKALESPWQPSRHDTKYEAIKIACVENASLVPSVAITLQECILRLISVAYAVLENRNVGSSIPTTVRYSTPALGVAWTDDELLGLFPCPCILLLQKLINQERQLTLSADQSAAGFASSDTFLQSLDTLQTMLRQAKPTTVASGTIQSTVSHLLHDLNENAANERSPNLLSGYQDFHPLALPPPTGSDLAQYAFNARARKQSEQSDDFTSNLIGSRSSSEFLQNCSPHNPVEYLEDDDENIDDHDFASFINIDEVEDDEPSGNAADHGSRDDVPLPRPLTPIASSHSTCNLGCMNRTSASRNQFRTTTDELSMKTAIGVAA